MITIKDFITNDDNENVVVLIRTESKDIWKGLLYDTPIKLHDREVLKEGYGLASQCNILTIAEK